MQSKVSKDGDRGGSRVLQTGPERITRPEPGSGYKLTTRNFTIETGLFTLDLSWEKVEVQPRSPLGPEGAASTAGSQTAPSRRNAPPDFHETLRRITLARLLETPPENHHASAPSQPAEPGPEPVKTAKQAGQAYERAAPAGPLTGGRRRFTA